MKFSESWLRTFVSPALDGEALADVLTMAGLEVEAVQAVAAPFASVVIAQVLSVEKHPDADRLQVCQVDTGENSPRQIVCGAANVAPGLKVPCALPGAVLPNGVNIKAAKVRGVDSAGMLCSAKELAMAEDADGLWLLPADAPLGLSIREFLDLDDRLFTLKLTPNRADCLSLTGIAREVSALTGAPMSGVEVSQISPTVDMQRQVVIDAPEACPRYCGRVIAGLDARAPTPEWMRRRLERSGIRSVAAVVDITNYVMLELGQPLHAFDNETLKGDIHVRWAVTGERLPLLNEQEAVVVDADILWIADEEGPLALAGIMGGKASAVTLDTQQVFLESAWFAPEALAGLSRNFGIPSDAAYRFERGVDFALTRQALERATALILAICGGAAGPVQECLAPLPARTPVLLRVDRVARVLGVPVTATDIAGFFERLQFDVLRQGNDFLVTPPSYRFDIAIEEDLIEEVARLQGYEHIPALPPIGHLQMLPQPERERPLSRVRQFFVDAGYQEVINFAFVEEAWENDFCGYSPIAEDGMPIRLANPISSQMSVMRSSLIGGLVANLSTNLKRKQERVRLFEVGRCFYRDTESAQPVPEFRQPWLLGGVAYGTALPEQWGVVSRPVDFYDVKAQLEALLFPLPVRFSRETHPALHPGRAARLTCRGESLGVMGELHPRWVQKYALPLPPIVFELSLHVLQQIDFPRYTEFSRFPPVVRDLAVVVDAELELQTLRDGLAEHCPALVQDVVLFDVYTGKGIDSGKKSLAFRIVMQDTRRTLQDAEVDAVIQSLLGYLQSAFAAQPRV